MLKGIPRILSPELFKILMEMGHGDELILVDGNFPAQSCGERVVRLDGHDIPVLLEAILQFFPLDTYVENAVFVMDVVEGDTKPVVWDEYREIIKKYEPSFSELERVERYAFYEKAKEAYAIVATGERALYGNIIIKKGTVS